MTSLTNLAEEARLTLANLTDAATDLAVPSLRLGVTGLARATTRRFLHTLVAEGFEFTSETDTEVAAQLLAAAFAESGDLTEAMRSVVKRGALPI